MVDPRYARQAAGHTRPWRLADARTRAGEFGRELAGVAEVGAPHGTETTRREPGCAFELHPCCNNRRAGLAACGGARPVSLRGCGVTNPLKEALTALADALAKRPVRSFY